MTLATLNFIYETLVHEEEIRRNAKKLAYQAWEDAESDNIALRDAVKKTRASWNEADKALREFEAQEW